MSETARNETQLGIADLKKRLGAVGLSVIDQRERFHHETTYFAIGTDTNRTDIVLSLEFLHDLPNTKDYQTMVDSYAHAVAGRLKCGSPELFYCRSGIAAQVSIRWPIQNAVYNDRLSTFVLMDVIRKPDGHIAKCSMEVGSRLGRTVFDIVIQTVNSVRSAIDMGQVKFYEPAIHQEVYQQIEYQQRPHERLPQPEIEQFIAGKAYILGFLAVDEPSDVWALDPWDAQYLGVSVKELSLAMRVLRAKGLLQPGSASDYARPTDKLLAERSSETASESPLRSRQQLSRSNLPNKEELLKDLRTALERNSAFAVLVIDLDHFKTVNDTQGHTEDDACLDRVVGTISGGVGRKGKIYRRGGDEFAVYLPDFSTGEAQATAERIRNGVEQAKPGGEVAVTTSIGVCGSDSTESKSAEELLDFADKAMYESKRTGKNRVTAWPFSFTGSKTATTVTKRMGEDERRKLADSVVLSVKTENGHHRNYTISVRNHSKFDLEVKRISLWSDGQRVSSPVFRPEGANWTVGADRQIPIGFDAGEIVSHRLWVLAGTPSKTDCITPRHLPGHFDAKVRVEVVYDVLEIEKTYDETRTVQVDPTNHTITGV